MARASAAETVGTTAEAAYDSADGVPAKSVWVACRSDSAVPLLVNVPCLHGTDYVELEAGQSLEFTSTPDLGRGSIDKVNVKGNGGTATYSHAITF